MATKQARSAALKIMMHPDKLAELRQLGEMLGQAPSTLASVAISHYVTQQMSSLTAGQNAIQKMVSDLQPQLVEQLKLMGDK